MVYIISINQTGGVSKMNFKSIRPSFINVDGWEILINESGNLELNKSYPIEIRKKARLQYKGMKKLFAASHEKDFFEKLGEKIHGNINTVEEKYRKLISVCTEESLEKIGAGMSFIINSYISGKYRIIINNPNAVQM